MQLITCSLVENTYVSRQFLDQFVKIRPTLPKKVLQAHQYSTKEN